MAAKAIDYLLSPNHRPVFTRFLCDGWVCLTNNAAERALRGVALGRTSASGGSVPCLPEASIT